MTELPKQYDAKSAQESWLKFWDEQGFFHSEPPPHPTLPHEGGGKVGSPYTIVIPPPNVTGALHMGHALNNTLQDVLIRYHRAKGDNAEWMPGTDHAGIATQAVVERLIFAQEKKTRRDLGREELVRRIWEWKEIYEKRILGQLKQLGCSCDWPRTRFTFDEGNNRAVRETFFKWFKDGYIYRGKRLVNWDTQLQTSVADDETYTENVQGGFWTFKYPVKTEPEASATDSSKTVADASGSDEFIRFSTTRPETMLGDVAICVHPNDERYQHLIGKSVSVPLVGREIPIIADGLLADPTLGTGAVKVTPAHDPNDYACWQRHPEIGMINILNPDGTINENGGKYAGLDRFKAREQVVADMEALGLFEGREDREIPLKYSDRSKSPIEPYLSDQWFVKMGDRDDGKPGLAQMAMDAVTSGRVKFTPDRYAKSYLDWLGEKRDWCISRQLWWGHRIPVWTYSPPVAFDQPAKAIGHTKRLAALQDRLLMWEKEGRVAIALSGLDEPDAALRRVTYPWCACVLNPDDREIITALEAEYFVEDPDVLDTWFSSQLWPYSTFGWPDKTPELDYYYPTSTLVTSRDIITLWVARMVLSGLYNMCDVPFRDVYITPKLLDGFGETMSKSKGNGVDPLDIIEAYGADALRYQMVFVSGDMQDSRLPVANICPHCATLVPVKHEHMYMRTKQLACPACKKPFRPGGPWPSDDPELPTAKQASERFEQGRNFANKLWNASRFLLMNLDGYEPGPIGVATLPVEDRWILSRLAATTSAVTDQLEQFRFSDVARTIYEFIWSEFCDWYVEMSKGRLKDAHGRVTAQRVLIGVLDAILRLVQPVMPFVAESVWQALGELAPVRGIPSPTAAAKSVCIAAWPVFLESWADASIERRFARMQVLIGKIREIRNRYSVDPKTEIDVHVRCAEAIAADFRALEPFVKQLAGIRTFDVGVDVKKPAQAAGVVLADFEAYVSLVGLIDVAKEIERLEKQIVEKEKYKKSIQAKLANEGFVARAPAEVVQQQRDLVAETDGQIRTLEENLRELEV
jgi:valyl-tRNA synthetase